MIYLFVLLFLLYIAGAVFFGYRKKTVFMILSIMLAVISFLLIWGTIWITVSIG